MGTLCDSSFLIQPGLAFAEHFFISLSHKRFDSIPVASRSNCAIDHFRLIQRRKFTFSMLMNHAYKKTIGYKHVYDGGEEEELLIDIFVCEMIEWIMRSSE